MSRGRSFRLVSSCQRSIAAREPLGWRPTQPGLIDDLDKRRYFRTPSA